jgi:hypothetical protein
MEAELLEKYKLKVQTDNRKYFEKKARYLATSKDKTDLDMRLSQMLNRELDLNIDLESLSQEESPVGLAALTPNLHQPVPANKYQVGNLGTTSQNQKGSTATHTQRFK